MKRSLPIGIKGEDVPLGQGDFPDCNVGATIAVSTYPFRRTDVECGARQMTMSHISRYALGFCAAATMLAGCGASEPSMPPGTVPQSALGALPWARRFGPAVHVDHRKSWMSPEARSIKKLLYVSAGNPSYVYDVRVYNYKTGAQVGTLTGFKLPWGQCVDAAGNVWITDYAGFVAEKFAHGGTTPIATVSTAGEPEGCAIDPQTGNLAVASEDASGGDAVIQVYNALGVSTYSNAACTYLTPPGYDNKGNLFSECFSGSTTNRVAELPADGTSLNIISFDRTIYDAGSAMWDGKHLTLTSYHYSSDSGATTIYQVKVNASGGLSEVGATVLTDTCVSDGNDEHTPFPFILGSKNTPANMRQGTVVVGGNDSCDYRFDYWPYPAGGNPTSSLVEAPLVAYGQSVSIATK
jgi:hypothetical protein